MKVYIIIKGIPYQGYEYPTGHYYTNKQDAQNDCDKYNKSAHTHDYEVCELTPIK